MAIFDSGGTPANSPELHHLDLGGDGLRALSYVPALAGYLAVSGPVAREATSFRLWFWRGPGDGKPRPVTVQGLDGFAHAEGVTPAIVDGQSALLIVSDDGNRAAGRPADYLLLDPAELQIGA